MKKLNCIVVFDQDKSNILFCKRMKDPYKGLFNFPGGKVENGENSLVAAYRELHEETGIGRNKIKLYHFMDLTYYADNFILELYVGQVREKVKLIEEVNPLIWLPLTENFADRTKYAGEQNIAHIVNMALKYPLEEEQSTEIDCEKVSVGIDGCKGGWIVAAIKNGCVELSKYFNIEEVIKDISYDGCLIDMIIGMQEKSTDVRPEPEARGELKGRASTIFPAPC